MIYPTLAPLPLAEPVDGAAEAGFELDFGCQPKTSLGVRHVEHAALLLARLGLGVDLFGVPAGEVVE